MGKPIEDLDVTIFEWPDRFFCEGEERDSDYRKHFNYEDFDERLPYLVDLSEYEDGKCGCRDFAVNIEPYINNTATKRTRCKHLVAVHRYKNLMGAQPKQLPPLNI